MNVQAILNPRAGVAAQRALRALEEARATWPGMQIRITRGPGDARAWAAEAAAGGCELVLAVGGDGTANEVAWGLRGSATTLGLVPVGSGNGLARTLGISLRPQQALRALAQGMPRRMDVGLANGKPFLNVAGAGFDAMIGADFHARGQAGRRRGLLPYVMLSLRRSLSYRADTWTLATGEPAFVGRAFVIAFLNGQQYGGAARIAPGARLDDGLLDVVVIEDAPWWELMLGASRLYLGGIESFRRYRLIPARAARLTASRPFAHHRDGEPESPAESLEVGLDPRSLCVLVPRAVAEDAGGPFAHSPLKTAPE